MLFNTTFEQFKELTAVSKRVVVSREIYADLLTPIRVFQVLAHEREQAVLLDSSDHATAQDACVYLGFDPIAEFNVTNAGVTVTNSQGQHALEGDCYDLLREFYTSHKSESQHSLAKFAGGMIGFMGYDSIRFVEDIPNRHQCDDYPIMNFKFYGTNVVFDKRTGKALITTVVEVSEDEEADYDQACTANDAIIHQMMNTSLEVSTPNAPKSDDPFDGVSLDIEDQAYKALVEKAQAYIRAGDIFQVVLSRRFTKSFTGNDFDIYRALRVLNPSPYQFYIRDKNYVVVGASPEKLVSLQNGMIESCPIAGTRPRGKDYDEDQQLEHELLNDEKEIAEHMMLIDLARNDVGAISEVGSVNVVELKKIKRFSSVMHIASLVEGKLAAGKDAFDVIKVTLPAGTLSGAPKIRAMEIIDELESSQRHLYGGAIVAIDNQGQMDSCIVIRTVTLKDNMATVRAGGGIVLDSTPQGEADETRHKVTGVLRALALAEGGLI